LSPPLVTFVLHKFSRGGSDRVATYLAKGFVEAGFRVELVVFAAGGEVEDLLLDEMKGMPVHFIGAGGRHRALDLLTGLPAFVRYLRRARPDVILSTANNTALISALGRAMARIPQARLVLKTTNPIATSRHRGFARQLRRWSYRRIFRSTQAVWTLSDEESDEMRAAFPEFADLFQTVIQPYVTPAMLASPGGHSRSDSPIILSIARLTKQKRLDRLIRGFANVRTNGARLLILGEGEERGELTALAGELGVWDRMTMPGYVPDVALALRDASLLVLTSDYEGLPAAVIEAMAANCPVLLTNCFPSAEALVRSADGCEMITDIEPEALGAQIDRMLEEPRPRSLAAIAARYSISNAVSSHVSALRRVMSEPGTGRDLSAKPD